MKTDRLTRVNELLRREIGLALYRIQAGNAFDTAAVTVTHVIVSSDLRRARVLVSIRAATAEQTRMLAGLRRHHAAIQELVARGVILKYTPRLQFELDSSLQEGDRVLEMLRELDGPAAPPPAPETSL